MKRKHTVASRILSGVLAAGIAAAAVPAAVAAATVEELPGAASAVGSALKSAGATVSRALQDSVTQLGQQNLQQVSLLYQIGKTTKTALVNVTTDGVDGDFKYNILHDGTAIITDYTGSATELTIPSEVDGVKVTCIGQNAFLDCDSLTIVEFSGNIENLCHNAFYKCDSLKRFEVSGNVNLVVESAFEDCPVLETIKIAGNIGEFYTGYEDWPAGSFEQIIVGCPSLKDLEIGGDVGCIGPEAFQNGALSNLKIGGNVENIGADSFYESSLSCVKIDGDIGSIGSVAFAECDALKSVEIGGVSKIGQAGFSGCDSLSNVTILNCVENIERNAFNYCPLLTKVSFLNSVGVVGENAFEGDASLLNISFGGNVGSIDSHAFTGCTALQSVVIEGDVGEINSNAFSKIYLLYDGCTALKSVSIAGNVGNIGANAFEDCDSLETITIKGTIENIGEYAFSGCTALKLVSFSDDINLIGEHAFSDCSSLTNIVFPGNVNIIGENAFTGCITLQNVEFKGDVGEIGSSAFSGQANPSKDSCFALESVSIDGNVGNIGYRAFCGCRSLEDIIFKGNIEKISAEAFESCMNLATVTFFNNVSYFGCGVFWGCTSLQDVIFRGDVDELNIGKLPIIDLVILGNVKSVDGGDSNVKSITVEGNVDSILGHAFSGCASLKKISVGGIVGEICFSAFSDDDYRMLSPCTALESIVIKNEVGTIGSHAFQGCTALKDASFLGNVETIDEGAFRDCSSLNNITISGLTSIGENTFYGCDSLVDIYYGGTKEEWMNINKTDCGLPNDVTIHYNSTGTETLFSDYRIGTVEDAWEGEGYLEYWVKIDGQTYQAGDTGVVMFPEYVKGKKLAYALDDQGRIGKYVMVSEPKTAKVSSYDAQRRSFHLGGDSTEYFLLENLTDPALLQNPEGFVGKTIKYTTVSSYDISRLGCCLVDMATIESHVGKLTNLDVLSDPWQVYLEGHDQPFPVDMSDEFLQDQLLSLQQQDTVITLTGGLVTAAYTPASLIRRSTRVTADVDDYPSGTRPTLSWEDGKYKHDEIVLSVTFSLGTDSVLGDTTELDNYFAAHAGEFATQINGITATPDASLDMLEGGTATDGLPVTLRLGESKTFTIPIKVKNGWFSKVEPDADIITGNIAIQVDGGSVWNASLPFEVRNEDLIAEEEKKRQEEAEKEEEKVDAPAIDAWDEFKSLNGDEDKDGTENIAIILPQNLEQYLKKEEERDAVRAAILTQIVLAKMEPENLIEKLKKYGVGETIAREAVDNMMIRCFGRNNFNVDVDRIEIPIELKMRTEDYGMIHVKLLCDIQNFSLGDSHFGTSGNISVQSLSVERKKGGVAVPGVGMIHEVDLTGFAQGVINVVSGELGAMTKLHPIEDLKTMTADMLTKDLSKYIYEKVARKISEKVVNKASDVTKKEMREFLESLQVVSSSQKQLRVHCPVDLYIYNADGILAGSIINDQAVSHDDNLQLWTKGDSKYIYILDGEYNIVYEARENGTMKVEISELGADDRDLRTVTFEEVPLVEGNLYTGKIEDMSIQDYALTAGNGIILEPDTITENRPEEPEEPVALPGDVNGDGKVTATDARMVLQAVAGTIVLTEEQKAAADYNKDGKITSTDAQMILQTVSGNK